MLAKAVQPAIPTPSRLWNDILVLVMMIMMVVVVMLMMMMVMMVMIRMTSVS